VLETLDTGRRSKRLSEVVEPLNFDYEEVTKFLSTKDGKSAFRGEWRHERAVGSAYWDPHGKRIVSTSYDDQLRGTVFNSFFYLLSNWMGASLGLYLQGSRLLRSVTFDASCCDHQAQHSVGELHRLSFKISSLIALRVDGSPL
jgi:hypothetical protein